MQAGADIETGTLPTGQRYAQIGSGSRLVLSIPALSFIAVASTPRAVRRLWRCWLDPITLAEDACAFLAGNGT